MMPFSDLKRRHGAMTVAALALAFALPSSPSPALAADARTILVLDASGSMWGQIGGEAKITIAQRVIGTLLDQLPEDEALGLYAYGHREKGNCGDIERLVAASLGSREAIRAAVNGLQPRGKTPLSDSVTMAAEELKYQEERATVVLISDGRETCDKDPCAVARALEAAGADFTAHVIGFDVADAEDIRQLSCIAEETGGNFYSASDAVELVAALETVVDTVVAAPEPESEPEPAPEPVVIAQADTGPFFVDEFDATELAEHWVVQNPDPAGYLVDAGQLILVEGFASAMRMAGASNIISLDHPLPRGDWDAEVDMILELKARHSIFEIGFFDAADNHIAGQIWIHDNPKREIQYGSRNDCAILRMMLVRGNDLTQDGIYFDELDNGPNCNGTANKSFDEQALAKLLDRMAEGVKVVFSKRGRSYSVKVELADGTVYETDSLTTLRTPGRLSLKVGNWAEGSGETLALIERITIREVQ